ncbi:lipase member H-A-like [Orussus abietinus]|uniref:lipase member H-A-like n=1 Tax=Orussus abietinus TaxID=222816 RepID=UPI00062561D9|nr:lipase member H-A-like [Orussus abietinus]
MTGIAVGRRFPAWIATLFLISWTGSSAEMIGGNLIVAGNVGSNSTRDFFLGPCLVNTERGCPDEEVTFFLFTRRNLDESQRINVTDSWSNLRETNFNPSHPTKIIIHGYNSDMYLDTLVDIRNEYLKNSEFNVVAVDWHRLATAPCYPTAVHNVPHVGQCVAQLINRIRDTGAKDIHAIGFSLGAHVPAFSANVLRPYKLFRITGLDPAMPLFVTVNNDEKLDAGDARFVDVFHTNAFIQGKVEPSGHIDFYMNGGVNQPGCWEHRNPFGCNHHRAAVYFAESINSDLGFWGWPCPGFLAYLLGLCPPRFPAVLAGDRVNRNYRGFHLVKTKGHPPYAEGIFDTDLMDLPR